MGIHWKQPPKNPAPFPTPKVYCPPLFGGVLNTHQSGVFSNTSLVQSVSYDTWQAPVRYLKKHKGKTIKSRSICSGKALSNGLLLELGPAHGLNLPQVGPYPGKGLQPGVDPTLFVLLWGKLSLLQIQ